MYSVTCGSGQSFHLLQLLFVIIIFIFIYCFNVYAPTPEGRSLNIFDNVYKFIERSGC